MPHTSRQLKPRPPDNWPAVAQGGEQEQQHFPYPPPAWQAAPAPSASLGQGQWRKGDGKPEEWVPREGAGHRWRLEFRPTQKGERAAYQGGADPSPLPSAPPPRPASPPRPPPPVAAPPPAPPPRASTAQLPGTREALPHFDRPFLPADVHPPSARPINLDPSWTGFAVSALHLGTLDERQFAHFGSEREVPLVQGLLEVKTGERKGDKVEPRGEVTLSGKGFAGEAAVKVVFQPGSLGAIYWARVPHEHGDARARESERYHLVLCTRWTPRFFAYKARTDCDNVIGQVRVTALDHKHASKTSLLSRHFLLDLHLPIDTSLQGHPPTPYSFLDLLGFFHDAGLVVADPLPSFRLLASRAYTGRVLTRLGAALGTLSPTLAFHVEGLVRTDGTLTPAEALRLVDEHVKPWEATAELGDAVTEDILIELRTLLEEDRVARAQRVLLRRFFEVDLDTSPPALDEWAEEARAHVVDERKRAELVPQVKKGAGAEHFWCRTITVTPSGSIKVGGRVLEKSNAVIRRYYDSVEGHKESDHFLRVLFRDEDGGQLGPMLNMPEHTKLLESSVGRALKQGVNFAGRTYEFLAYSQSGLRERAVWFVAPWLVEEGLQTKIVDAEAIRRRFGSFVKIERMPAKLGSRFSQGFTASHATEVLHYNQIDSCDDILEVDQDGNELTNHTDGAGLISTDLCEQVWATLQAKGFRRNRDGPAPSVFQIRLGGSKGILVLDHNLKGSRLVIRPSQNKYLGSAETEGGERFCLNVADAFTRPNPLRLNRPLISALDDLGIDTDVFLRYQKVAIDELQPEQLATLHGAHHALHRFSFGHATRFKSLLESLLDKGLPDSILREEPFLHGALEVVRARSLRDLRDKAAIPVADAYVLVGVPDQDRVLQENEVFAALRFPDKPDDVVYLEGKIVITRSPSTDPGDIRIVHAIGKPPAGAPWRLCSLENCLVLPTVGERAIASMMGGGDLDGDTYQVLCRSDLVPRSMASPRPYEGDPPLELDRAATIDDVADCLLAFVASDSTCIIATNHLVVADKSRLHGFDPICQQLADLYSLAVDAAKTGNVVSLDRLPDLPDKKRRPDFLRKTDLEDLTGYNERAFEYYPSQRALGHLYRAVDESGLKTPSAVYGGPVLGDGMSVSFGYLRLLVEADLASLLDSPPEPLKHVPPSYYDTVAPILASFTALFANIARTHTPPNNTGRQVSELELFAVTSLLASQRHDAARGSAIAAMAREVAALVNWLERELTSASSRPLGERVDGETLRLRYSAWVTAVESGEEWTVGTKSARWICLALLLETMRTEKARRDQLDEARSPSEVHGPVGPIYGQVAVHSHPLIRPQQPTPPPSPPVTRSGRSVPSSTPMAPTVPLATRPRISTSRTASVPTHPPAAPSLHLDHSPFPLRPALPPLRASRPPLGMHAVDPEDTNAEQQARRRLAASQPGALGQPRTYSYAHSDASDAGGSPLPAPQPLGSLVAPPTPYAETDAHLALGAYESSSDDGDPLEAQTLQAFGALGLEHGLGPSDGRAASAGQRLAASTEEEELDEQEAAAEAERDKLWQEFRRRKYLEGVAVPLHRPGRRAPTTATSRTGASAPAGASWALTPQGGTLRHAHEAPAATTYPSNSWRSTSSSAAEPRHEQPAGDHVQDWVAHDPALTRHAASSFSPPHADVGRDAAYSPHQAAVPLAHPAPRRPFLGASGRRDAPLGAAPASHAFPPPPAPSDIHSPWSPPPYAPTSPANDADEQQDEYEPPPTPPDKRRGYFQGGAAPFWAHFDDRDRRRYKSNLSGESKLGRYVLDADGRPYRESIGLGVLRFPERRSETHVRSGAGWAPGGDEGSWLEQARREAAAREEAAQAGAGGWGARGDRAWLAGDGESGGVGRPPPRAQHGVVEHAPSSATTAEVGWGPPRAASSWEAAAPAQDLGASGWASSSRAYAPRPPLDAASSSARPSARPPPRAPLAPGPAPARASKPPSNPLMSGIMATINARKAEVEAVKKARLRERSRWNG
ncbi:hypothetical protein JCM9279_003864 [Rhodotorula babjevae]